MKIEVVSSELTLLEKLVGPMKNGDASVVNDYEELLTITEVRLLPITATILRAAANLRAILNLKTLNAIHAASALAAGCAQFINNDTDFDRVSALPVVNLSKVAST